VPTHNRVVSTADEDGWARYGGDDPFATPDQERDPVRRLRGRLPSSVTVWTAWDPRRRAVGVTVSSVMIGEGEPPLVFGLLSPLADVWEAIQARGSWVMHLLAGDQVRLSDQMAGRYPDDPFRGFEITESAVGPVLSQARTRAMCSLIEGRELGWSMLVVGRVDAIELGPPDKPLVHYRSAYYGLAPRHPISDGTD
jgi:3-hydroxy-9,10-secoandrosta-1,3,5(10)-triene-9,17-dione monooxygenase reductase component